MTKNMHCGNEDGIGLTPVVDSKIATPEPSIYTGFFIVVLFSALAFIAAVSG